MCDISPVRYTLPERCYTMRLRRELEYSDVLAGSYSFKIAANRIDRVLTLP